MSKGFVIKWNRDNTYFQFKDRWDWVDNIEKADQFASVSELQAFVQRRVSHWDGPAYNTKPYSIIEVNASKTANASKFVIRWISDNTYLQGETLSAVTWTKLIHEAKQFDSAEEADKFLVYPESGVRWWRGSTRSPDVSIEEIHILNFRSEYG